MKSLCAVLSIAVLASLAGCSKEEDAEVKAMKESIGKVTATLRAEEEKLRDQKRIIETRLDTISLRIRQMDALSTAMDKEVMPVAASKEEEKKISEAELKLLKEHKAARDRMEVDQLKRDQKKELDDKLKSQEKSNPKP